MFDSVKIRDGHDNFFTPLRLLMALMVLFGHTFHVAQGHAFSVPAMAEPKMFLDYEMSYIAVNMFFIVSGFLVTKSILYRGNMADYASARILRIFPALAFHVLFVIFIMGPFVTQLPWAEFFSHPQVYTQPAQVLSFYETSMTLPAAFEGNPQQVASSPLWTLRYEVLAYMGTAMLFSLGLFRRNWMILVQCILCFAFWTAAHLSGVFETLMPTLKGIIRFGMCYSLGAAIYAYRDKFVFHITAVPILILTAALFRGTVFFEIGLNICLAYIIFWLAYMHLPKLNSLKKLSDISYGVYIYHYCILQWVYYVHPNITTFELFTLTLPITVILASVSWHFVEKPALAQKQKFARFLRFKTQPTKPAFLAVAE